MVVKTSSLKDSDICASKFDRGVFFAFLLALVVVPLVVVPALRVSAPKWYLIQTSFPLLVVILVYHSRLRRTLEMAGRIAEAKTAYLETLKLVPNHVEPLKALWGLTSK